MGLTTDFAEGRLAPYACHPERSLGRRVFEEISGGRTEFQRDRDRVIHCNAFRRLEYKTQVFVNHEGDRYRTRLTHSLEVAQIARGICRLLGLNVDLAEAISLAHDLGHTPFGHSGQSALNDAMREFGGFEHNRQSLRIVDYLEDRYMAFRGLNLTFETREGIAKHRSSYDAPESADVYTFTAANGPSLEAQVANLADEIAYNTHDIDDAVNAGIVTIDDMTEVPLFARLHGQVMATWPDAPRNKQLYETGRRLINHLITDVVTHTRTRIAETGVATVDDVRALPDNIVTLSPETAPENAELKRFLFRRVYRFWRVQRMGTKAERVIHELFAAFTGNPALLPPQYQAMLTDRAPATVARVVADYVSGMTDRYALGEYKKLFDPWERV
ncbi:MAG: deoxyguanosinetriphosphate triphosphohydrolase [Nitrospirae bacterium]|nr:deoxyguanosinetriphosphate triphosphohydrolase [Nitrospirota bacterium]